MQETAQEPRPAHPRHAPYVAVAVLAAAGLAAAAFAMTGSFSATEPGFDDAAEQDFAQPVESAPYADWTRPEGPIRVALQAGHWKNDEVPDELENLKFNGAIKAGYHEWKVVLAIAERAKMLLEKEGYAVDILPTTVPPEYWADAFVSIHADDHPNRAVSGYKGAAPWRDLTGKAAALNASVESAYAEATGLPYDPGVTRNMRGYYAFNWRRYDHALHPMTPAIIFETGFLSSPTDRRVIVNHPDVAARGIANGINPFFAANPPAAAPSDAELQR